MTHLDFVELPAAGVRLQAAAWHGDGECLRVHDLAEIRSTMDSGAPVIWVNMVVVDKTLAMDSLIHDLGFQPSAAHDAVVDTERPVLRQFPDYLYLSVHQIVVGPNGEDYPEIAIFLGKSYLVTLTHEPVDALQRWFDSWRTLPSGVGEHPAFLLHNLLDELIDDYFPATDELETEIDETEDQLYNSTEVETRHILSYKRRLLEIRRKISPTRDILNALLRRDLKLIPDNAKIDYQDLYDRSLRVIERIDVNRDILSDIMSAHQTQISNNLNQVMKVLTVVSTILMTMAFWTGLYGMNFKVMPELYWKYGYAGLWGVLICSAAVEVWFFRRQKWI